MTPASYTILSAALTLGGVLLGKLLERKKSNAEIEKLRTEREGSELDNIDKAVKIWRELAMSLEKTVNDLRTECHALSDQVNQLRKENHSLKSDIKKLKDSIDNSNK